MRFFTSLIDYEAADIPVYVQMKEYKNVYIYMTQWCCDQPHILYKNNYWIVKKKTEPKTCVCVL